MFSDTDSQLLKNITCSCHKFTADLYKLLGKENNENCFFSPASIYLALVLTYIGAKGKTAEELEKYLYLPQRKEDLLKGVRLLLDQVKNSRELNTATEIFVEKTYNIKPEYKDLAKKFLDSESQTVNFKTAFQEAEKLINNWVSTQTKEKIKDLIPNGTLNEATKLVLVNAIHFKDEWGKTFKEANTRLENFYVSKENTVQVPMMHQTDYFQYLEKENYKVLELPYKNKEFRMIVILPHTIDGLPALEGMVNASNINDILLDLHSAKVRVSLPKFKLENFVDLNIVLKTLGIVTMFTEGAADFTGIHETQEQPLYVGNVLHKAFVEVNEKGTEAAAATAVRMMLCCARPPTPVAEFTADHPFSYYIMFHNKILFIGKNVTISK